jgi:hypothetical protein
VFHDTFTKDAEASNQHMSYFYRKSQSFERSTRIGGPTAEARISTSLFMKSCLSQPFVDVSWR